MIDMADYVIRLTKNEKIESVLDLGTGMKGVVAQHYWEKVKNIERGYACDIWSIKKLPPVWTPLKMDALDLLDVLEAKNIDVVQAFGFLEHLTKENGYKFLDIAETLARKLVIVSAANCIHGFDKNVPGYDPDYKVKADGNPYHRYNSTWHWREFEELGYTSNIEDAMAGNTFRLESIAWKRIK
ncbi:hypothetical protein ES702_07752 [subsurface metagenome]